MAHRSIITHQFFLWCLLITGNNWSCSFSFAAHHQPTSKPASSRFHSISPESRIVKLDAYPPRRRIRRLRQIIVGHRDSTWFTQLRSGGDGASLLAEVAPDDDGNHPIEGDKQTLLFSRSLLLLVAFLYGTLNVCLRRVYALENPPTAPALSAVRGWLSALCFLYLPIQQKMRRQKTNSSQQQSTSTGEWTNTVETQQKQGSTGLNPTRFLLWFTAFDLALWNFAAQGLINVGLLHCSSARASFLTQSSVIFTPLLSLGANHRIPPPLWCAVGVAFSGLCILSSSGGGGAAISSSTATMTSITTGTAGLFHSLRTWLTSIHPGDGLVLAGALCWSMYLLRLSRASSPNNNKYRIEFPTLPLQGIKTLLMAIMYTCWWLFSSCGTKTTAATKAAAVWWTSGAAWFWLVVSAIGPGAIADVLQQKGQQRVSAAEANIILSAEPVFSGISGFVLLGEAVSVREMVGGSIILLAAVLSSLST